MYRRGIVVDVITDYSEPSEHVDLCRALGTPPCISGCLEKSEEFLDQPSHKLMLKKTLFHEVSYLIPPAL
jgi:hypothetical protein